MTVRTPRNPELDSYLRSVRSHLPLRESGDILLELESTVLDRVEELALSEDREPDAELVQRVLDDLGEPEAVARSYSTERYLIGPDAYRPFLVYTALVFAVHLSVIGIASALGRPLELILVQISPLESAGLWPFLRTAFTTLLTDIGLTVLCFAVAPLFRRSFWSSTPSFAVQARPRDAVGRAALSLLVAALLGWFHERLLVVVVGETAYPLATDELRRSLPLLVAVLVAAGLKDGLYAAFGERRWTLSVDALHGALSIAALMFVLGDTPLLALPTAAVFRDILVPVNVFLQGVGDLVIVSAVVLLAVKTLRRLVRVSQV